MSCSAAGLAIAFATSMMLIQSAAVGQVAFFSRYTDTIRLPGATVLTTSATFEARVMLMPGSTFIGRIWNEHLAGFEDKTLAISTGSLHGFGWPSGTPSLMTATVAIAPYQWHHVAFVRDASQERLYLNGTLAGTRTVSNSIRNSTGGVAAVGAIRRTEGIVGASFIGYIDTLRISSSARYSGSFTPAAGDLDTDATTLLLLNFNEPRDNPTVSDLSGHGENGSLTTWFTEATLPQLCPDPLIVDDPQPTRACAGTDANFTVTAVGNGPFTYGWRFDGTPIDPGTNPSAATETLTRSSITAADIGSYDCIVTNACGSVTSNPASLTTCPGDFNCDGGVDGEDVGAFFNDWEAGNAAADINADGGVDGADVSTFFEHWEAGC